MPEKQMNIKVMNELFNQRKENLDRFTSLMNILLISSGLYVAIYSFILENMSIDEKFTSLINNIDIKNTNICLFFIVISFLIIATNMIKTIKYNKLIENRGFIQFKEDRNLEQYNEKLFNDIKIQNFGFGI